MTGLTMKKANRVKLFEEYLEELFPNPRCELEYSKDYELLIAVVLSAQTTDKRVNQVTRLLFERYPSLEALATADLEEVAEILKPIGTFHKKAVFVQKIAKVLLEEYNGHVPNDPVSLQKMPGVGRKTTNVVLSNLYDYPAIAVDTHVERVSKRLGFCKESDDVRKVEVKLQKLYAKRNWARRHHQMVLFGRYHCKAMKPECDQCKMKEACGYVQKLNKK